MSPTTAATVDPDLVAQEHARATRDDARIATQLGARLARQEGLVDVASAVSGGVVTLSGKVLDAADRELAESIAASIEGVIAVQQQIAINASLRERVNPALEQAQDKLLRLVAALPLLLVASVIIVGFVWFGRFLGRRLYLLRWGSGNPYLDTLLRRGVHLTTLLVGVLIALDLLGATALVGAVLGSAGVLGIMLGFAFRDIAENHLAGVLLSLRRPFEPGDHIMVNGHEGKVISLNSRATVLMTLDGNHLRLPNAMVFKGVLLNYTRNPMRRLQFTLGIGTGEDLNAARRLGVETLRNITAIATEPEPQAMIQSVGDSSVLIDFFAWLDQREVDFLKTRSEAIRQVKCAIEDEGMDMPEPISRVQLISSVDDSHALALPGRAEPRANKPRLLEEIQPDVSVTHGLDIQIARERATQQGEDLLQHPAPRE
ncbi:MAG: mechanosensitive ion channel family protein [Haliea sp.]